jgi:hypothetical protein
MDNDTLKDLIKREIYANAPMTAKEIHTYLNSEGYKCELYEVAEQLTLLIHASLICVGEEGNTFQPQ